MSAVKRLNSPLGKESVNYQFVPNRRILVVEDEREIARLYADVLGSKNSKVIPLATSRLAKPVSNPGGESEFEVTIVQNAEEALAHVKSSLQKNQPFAMGFFDVLLGHGMDGIELVKAIHALDKNLYAVFVTAYQDRSVDAIRSVLEDSKSSHWDYLNKPFSTGEILQKARNFSSLWNLEAEKKLRDEQLADIHQKLLESERSSAVAAVARGISHEFGNILMQIMGKADLGRMKPEAEMRQSLERILDASQRAASILDQFKDLSRTGGEKGHVKAKARPADLVNEAIDLMESTFRNSKVKPCRVKMDSSECIANVTSLLQVIVNVTINAVHAMPGGGQIDYSVVDMDDHVEIRIRDYGPGIPEPMIHQVLEPFFTTKGQKGTGLGLSISKEIVEIEHRGEFKLQNHSIKGLEIILSLPKGE